MKFFITLSQVASLTIALVTSTMVHARETLSYEGMDSDSSCCEDVPPNIDPDPEPVPPLIDDPPMPGFYPEPDPVPPLIDDPPMPGFYPEPDPVPPPTVDDPPRPDCWGGGGCCDHAPRPIVPIDVPVIPLIGEK